MKTIKCTDKNGITHNINPNYVVDVYKAPNAMGDNLCITILLGKDSGMNPPIMAIPFQTEEKCDESFKSIIEALESI